MITTANILKTFQRFTLYDKKTANEFLQMLFLIYDFNIYK